MNRFSCSTQIQTRTHNVTPTPQDSCASRHVLRHIVSACAGLWLAVGGAGLACAGTVTDVQFINGLTLDGAATDASTSGTAAERRLGYFSDLYYDSTRNEWWGLSDRGPGGGLLDYGTRVQRFTLDVAPNGAISNFQIAATVTFKDGGVPMNGLAPNPGSTLGRAFDPEGFVVNPKTGNLLVSDEYGPSLIEFDRNGQLLRRFEVPANLVPRDAATGTPNFASDDGNTAGRRSNRGLEGLTISADGRFAYAVMQSALLDEGGGDGRFVRIIKFDTATGTAVAQYAYKLDRSGQGQGVSALVALGGDRFLVLERNNRGVGIDATLNTADKSVYEIDLSAAVDVSGVTLPATGSFAGAVNKVAKVMDLDADTLAALGNLSPEKWEGLTVGPMIGPDLYLMLAGTDNDYSVTQSGSGEQFDVWLRFSDADPYATSIQCPIGSDTGCFFTDGSGSTGLSGDYSLLPGVLHAYAVRIDGFERPLPVPGSLTLAAVALVLLSGTGRRRR
jgi:hypothetical protein